MKHAVMTGLSEADYLEGERASQIRHEYVSGEVFATAGASERKNRIAGNIFFPLRSATRGKTCRAFMADMKPRLTSGTPYYYPDAMLVCDPADDHPIYKQSPCFIAEVLSPATASIDVREKLAAYRGLASLRYYPLVDSERLWAKMFFRDEHGAWFEQELSPEDRVDVVCGDARLALSLDDFYEDTGLLVV